MTYYQNVLRLPYRTLQNNKCLNQQKDVGAERVDALHIEALRLPTTSEHTTIEPPRPIIWEIYRLSSFRPGMTEKLLWPVPTSIKAWHLQLLAREVIEISQVSIRTRHALSKRLSKKSSLYSSLRKTSQEPFAAFLSEDRADFTALEWRRCKIKENLRENSQSTT